MGQVRLGRNQSRLVCARRHHDPRKQGIDHRDQTLHIGHLSAQPDQACPVSQQNKRHQEHERSWLHVGQRDPKAGVDRTEIADITVPIVTAS